MACLLRPGEEGKAFSGWAIKEGRHPFQIPRGQKKIFARDSRDSHYETGRTLLPGN